MFPSIHVETPCKRISSSQHTTTFSNPNPNPCNNALLLLSTLHFNNNPPLFLNPSYPDLTTPPPPPPPPPPQLPPASISCFSNSSPATSDEAEVIDERKQRRMISNRESARRSRMRKQRHLDELWSQVMRLRTENHDLLERLNRASETHNVALEENARLKEEASGLRELVRDLQIINGGCGSGDDDQVMMTPGPKSSSPSLGP